MTNRIHHQAAAHLPLPPRRRPAMRRTQLAAALLATLAWGGSAAAQDIIDNDQTVTVDGKGGGSQASPWNVSGTGGLWVGVDGRGELRVQNGGQVNVTGKSGLLLGVDGSGAGYVYVDGAGSTLTTTSTQIGGISAGATGYLSVTNGGALIAQNRLTLGADLNGPGTLDVSGTGASVTTKTLSVGWLLGPGTLNVKDGASLASQDSYIGGSPDNAQTGPGTGSVTISGMGATWRNAGNLTLGYASFSPTYAAALGVRNLSQGTLTVADGGTVSVGGVLSLGGGIGFTAAGVPTAQSTVNLDSGGTLEVGGAQGIKYVGGSYAFNIDGGTLRVVGTDLTTGIDATLSHDATLDTNGLNAAWNGTLGGTGALVKTGTGSLILSGSNTYTGGTRVQGGTLVAGTATAFVQHAVYATGGSGTLDLGGYDLAVSSLSGDGGGIALGGATLTVDQAATTTYAGTLTGSGRLVKTGAGTLVLNGANTYAGGTDIEAGTLQGTAAGLQGNIVDKADLVFDQPDEGVFAGTLSGNGTMEKTGQGKLVFNGDGNGFTGVTAIHQGTLVVGDADHANVVLNGNYIVDASATLGGYGTIGNLDLSGTLSPGNSIGTLKVAGNAILRPGSVYLAQTDAAGNTDSLIVGGKLTIEAGSSLKIQTENGHWNPNADYQLLQASGGVEGQFGHVSVDSAFLNAQVTYTGDGFAVSLQRNALDFASVALTPNQRAIAGALQPQDADNPLYKAVVMLDAHTAANALDQLSGEIHADARGELLLQSGDLRDAIWMRTPAQAGGFWVQGIGVKDHFVQEANADRLQGHREGMLIGADARLGDDGYLGAAGGYTDSTQTIAASRSSTDGKTASLGIYGGVQLGRFALDAGAGYANHRLDSHRFVNFADIAEQLGGDYRAHTMQFFARGSVALTGILSGFLEAAHVQVKANGFHEQGGDAALAVAGGTERATYATPGLRLDLPAGDGVRVFGSLGLRHRFGGGARTEATATLDGSDAFVVQGPQIGRNTVLTHLGVDWRLGRIGALSLAYTGLNGGGEGNNGLNLTYSAKF
ncbi:autotransporter outer membrane beta-barrel domain-containing protein [Dyella sedimenti]|uniref:autotransporter outer membrane beta-barrel domain-containing protein n=1 Tax=Dyella sedimenti TaxID=2919947 RepID=UPI001FA99210|nr:autotransporter domain-containing protein [Dyella sedimenti]